jgi:tRNA A37 N6-isopentenylltransferase MiaA
VRQFAKRQLTWFRRQLDPEWIGLKPEEPLEKCVQKIGEPFLQSRSDER